MIRNKKIKGGGINVNNITLPYIKNLSTPNNLNPRDVLLNNGYLDDDGYILDNEGKRIEDSVNFTAINYEDAILINDNLYDINSIYQTIIRQAGLNKIDVIRQAIPQKDIEKIHIKIMSNFNNPNNLKSLQELISLYKIKLSREKYIISNHREDFLKDPYTNEAIEYKDAFLFNGIIYNVISLYSEIIKTGNYPDKEVMKKIKLMIPYTKRIGDLNKLKSLETLKTLGYIDDEKYLIGDDDLRVKDPLTDKEIKYENGILINGNLYNVQSLFIKLFLNEAGQTKKDHLNNDISRKDEEEIHLTYNKLFKICNPLSPNNLKSLLHLKNMGLIDDDNYFIDTTDPITRNRIKYEDAIFVNGNVYDINSIYEFIYKDEDEIKKDFVGFEISKEVIDKINKKKISFLIKDTSNYNNLKNFDDLKLIGNVISSNMVFNDNIIDLFTNYTIYYDDAILINDNIYKINSIYKRVVIDNNDTDWFGIKIPDEDIKKIKKMHFMWQICNLEKPIELIPLEDLKQLRLVDDENHILDENGNPFIDPYTDLKIKYGNAIIINNNLYDVISLYIAVSIRDENKVDYYNRRIINLYYKLVEDKYELMILRNLGKYYYYVLNIYYKQIEKRVRGIDVNDVNLEDVEYINDLIKSFYENLIKNNHTFNIINIINDYFKNIFEIIIYYLRIINKLEDRIRLIHYPLIIIIDILNKIFKKVNKTDKQKIQYYYNLYLYTNHFNKYLDTTNLNTFLDLCLSLLLFLNDNDYELFLEKQQQEAINLNLLKKRVANELAKEFIRICESNDIDVLTNFLNEIKKALSLSIISENEKILKILALHLIKKSLEIVKSSIEPSVAIEFIKKSSEIAYKLSFKADMKDVFDDVYIKHHHYLFKVLLSFKINYYDIIFEGRTGIYEGITFNKTKYLEDAREKIKKEYDDFIKNFLKAYENILKIYMLSFMDDIDRSKIAKLEKNIDKCYKKAEQNFNIAKKAFTTYENIRPPTVKERVAKGIKGISSYLSRNKIVPVENSRSNVSPIESISIPKPKIPSLSRKSLRALPRRKKTN